MIKFTIITVCYNCKDTIERTIRSVLSQNYKNIEYIIVDGASIDGTCEIIDNYRDKVSLYISEPDNGVYDAMNKGIRHSSGDVIEFLNADDYYYDNNTLSDVAKIMNTERDIDILVGKDAENLASSIHYPDKYKSVYIDAIFPHQALFARRKVFDEIGLFDEKYDICADRDWILNAWQLGYIFRLIDQELVFYEAGGLSFGCNTPLEEYAIAVKYLNRTGQPELIPLAGERAWQIFGDCYVRNLFDNGKYEEEQNVLWKNLLKGYHRCIIYGIGQFGLRIVNSLRTRDIQVIGTIDKGTFRNADGLIIEYELNDLIDYPIIIASSDYDKEIYDNLINAGVTSDMIIKFETIRESVMKLFNKEEYPAEFVKEKFGIDFHRYN